MEPAPTETPPIQILLEGREAFLAFLQRRLGSRELADDLLQRAYLKAIEREGQLREDERAVAWFYRLLRNAVADHWRGRGAEARALEALARETADAVEPPAELESELCRCFEPLLPALRDDHARILRAVDLAGERPVDYAAREGITANNAMVRLHRARTALRERLLQACRACATHGCLDCTCRDGANMGV